MTERVAAEPTLYSAEGSVALHGRRCTACGHVCFPPQAYGCEACGAGPQSLASQDLPACGTLVASVAVLRHPLAPFTVGTVLLDSGPAVRAVIEAPGSDLLPGTRMRGVLVATGASAGATVVELWFAPEET